MLNKNLALFFILSFVALSVSQKAQAEVETIAIKQGDVVSKDIAINPGFAVMFQFPDETVAITLADQTSFACDKMPTDTTRVLCKPLTQSPFATNLVVTTSSNEFNLVLSVDPTGKKHPFKYVFYSGKTPTVTGQSISRQSLAIQSSQNLMDLISDHFASRPCRAKGESPAVLFKGTDIIEIGTERFLRFSLVGKGSGAVRVVRITVAHESLGGLTGLSIKDEKSVDVNYSLKSEVINPGSEVTGVLKLPQNSTGEHQRQSLVVMTDQGVKNDVRVYGL